MGDPLKNITLQMRQRAVALKPANANQTHHTASISGGGSINLDAPFLPNLKLYLQGSFNGYAGGMGTKYITNGNPESDSDLIVSFGGSLGWGHNTPIRIDMLNQNTTNAITNNNDVAIIYQTNVVFKRLGLGQINASIGLRVYNFTFSTYNDVSSYGLTDGGDERLTGGFQAAWHFDKVGSLTFGSDIFTGERMIDQTGRYKRFESGGRLYYEESQTDILLNRGSIYVKATRENGGFFMIDYSGKGAMLLQDFIHDNVVHVPRFMSVVPDTLMFYFGNEF